MKQKYVKILFAAMAVVLVMAVSVNSIGALTLYEHEGYTYVDIGGDKVALYNWDNSSPVLKVKTFYNSKEITSIYKYSFQNNDVITSIDFSEAALIKDIGIMAFDNCSGLEGNLVLPNTLDSIGFGAFQNCSNLYSVTIANVSVIPQQCFYCDSTLRIVNLPVSLKRIEKLAFADCAIGTIFIPSSVDYIDETAFLNCRSVTINCYFNSYAHEYAKDNGIPYVLIDNFKLGDVNMDGYVNINDVTLIQRNLAELEDFNELQELAADANRDGFVDISDATVIQMYLAEYEMEYPIGKVMTQ